MKLADKNGEYFGLDIGTTGVRLVQIRQVDTRPTLVVYAEKDIELAKDSNEEPDDEMLVAAIRGAVKESGVEAESVIVALANRDISSKVVTTPKLEPAALADHMRASARDYLPSIDENSRLDWYVINPELSPTEMEVLLVAANADAVDRLVKLVEKAGLKLAAVEADALAVARSLFTVDDSSLSAVVDLGSTKTEVTLVWRRLPYVVGSVDVGGETFTERVAESFNVDTDQAESFLRDFGLTESKLEGGVVKAIGAEVDQVLEKVSSSIDQFKTQVGNVEFGRMVLTGVPVSLPGLPSYMAERLQLPAEIANPWVNVSYPAAEHDRLMSRSLRFAVASGLAQKDSV